MKLIETVETVIDLTLLKKVIQKHASPMELPRINRWMKRLEKEGPLFLRKRYKMPLKEYQSVYFHRFDTFVSLATVKRHLTYRMSPV
jgi:hypothetical protein